MKVKWTNRTGDSRWENPMNWSNLAVPTADDDVIVNPKHGALIINCDAECRNYTQKNGNFTYGKADADFSIMDGTLTIHGNCTLGTLPWYRHIYNAIRWRWFRLLEKLGLWKQPEIEFEYEDEDD
jgi:hypothetical protein